MRDPTSEVIHARRIENLKCRRARGKRSERANEIARGRDRKMSRQRTAIGPLLDEHQPKRILAVDMHGMREATRLGA